MQPRLIATPNESNDVGIQYMLRAQRGQNHSEAQVRNVPTETLSHFVGLHFGGSGKRGRVATSGKTQVTIS